MLNRRNGRHIHAVKIVNTISYDQRDNPAWAAVNSNSPGKWMNLKLVTSGVELSAVLSLFSKSGTRHSTVSPTDVLF